MARAGLGGKATGAISAVFGAALTVTTILLAWPAVFQLREQHNVETIVRNEDAVVRLLAKVARSTKSTVEREILKRELAQQSTSDLALQLRQTDSRQYRESLRDMMQAELQSIERSNRFITEQMRFHRNIQTELLTALAAASKATKSLDAEPFEQAVLVHDNLLELERHGDERLSEWRKAFEQATALAKGGAFVGYSGMTQEVLRMQSFAGHHFGDADSATLERILQRAIDESESQKPTDEEYIAEHYWASLALLAVSADKGQFEISNACFARLKERLPAAFLKRRLGALRMKSSGGASTCKE